MSYFVTYVLQLVNLGGSIKKLPGWKINVVYPFRDVWWIMFYQIPGWKHFNHTMCVYIFIYTYVYTHTLYVYTHILCVYTYTHTYIYIYTYTPPLVLFSGDPWLIYIMSSLYTCTGANGCFACAWEQPTCSTGELKTNDETSIQWNTVQ